MTHLVYLINLIYWFFLLVIHWAYFYYSILFIDFITVEMVNFYSEYKSLLNLVFTWHNNDNFVLLIEWEHNYSEIWQPVKHSISKLLSSSSSWSDHAPLDPAPSSNHLSSKTLEYVVTMLRMKQLHVLRETTGGGIKSGDSFNNNIAWW